MLNTLSEKSRPDLHTPDSAICLACESTRRQTSQRRAVIEKLKHLVPGLDVFLRLWDILRFIISR